MCLLASRRRKSKEGRTLPALSSLSMVHQVAIRSSPACWSHIGCRLMSRCSKHRGGWAWPTALSTLRRGHTRSTVARSLRNDLRWLTTTEVQP